MMTSRFSTLTFVICLLLSLILVVHLLFGFLTPIMVALVIVSIFSHAHQHVLKWTGNRPYLASGLSTFMVLLLVLIPLSLFFVVLAQQSLVLFQLTERFTAEGEFFDLTTSLKHYIGVVNEYLDSFHIKLSPERILQVAENFAQAIGNKLYQGLGLAAANTLSLILNFLLTIALVFVFFVSGRATKIFIMELVPWPEDEKERVVKRFRDLTFAVFVGNGLISVVEGTLGGISFLVFGLDGALLFGVLIAITAFLPLIGASIVIFPATVYIFLAQGSYPATLFFVFNSLQMITLETLVKPRVIGTKSQMHAALVFMSILAGVQTYGVLGLFYGPLLVTVFLTLVEIYKDHYRDELLKG